MSSQPTRVPTSWVTGASLCRVAFVLLLLRPNAATAQAPTAAMVAAGVVPGQRMRVISTIREGDVIIPERDRRYDGLLVDIDSASVTLRLDDSTTRRFVHADVETLQAYRGRSRWRGLLAGWLIGAPIAAVACRNATYECSEGSAIGLVSGVAGLIVGWPRWEDVQFP